MSSLASCPSHPQPTQAPLLMRASLTALAPRPSLSLLPVPLHGHEVRGLTHIPLSLFPCAAFPQEGACVSKVGTEQACAPKTLEELNLIESANFSSLLD